MCVRVVNNLSKRIIFFACRIFIFQYVQHFYPQEYSDNSHQINRKLPQKEKIEWYPLAFPFIYFILEQNEWKLYPTTPFVIEGTKTVLKFHKICLYKFEKELRTCGLFKYSLEIYWCLNDITLPIMIMLQIYFLCLILDVVS